ncbi:daptide-type RiPP [Actinoplanes subglobosus]|uniref:Daptide-type RiPP n=1 Tax=Actinoplanes subglobosus TaxID=1547892 RepID=A0ABV8IVA2_9ACTN
MSDIENVEHNDTVTPDLELGLQELEAMEAPGWWTAAGVSAGVVVTSAAGYGGYIASVAILT